MAADVVLFLEQGHRSIQVTECPTKEREFVSPQKYMLPELSFGLIAGVSDALLQFRDPEPLLVDIEVRRRSDISRIRVLQAGRSGGLFGDELEVPTVDGAATFDIPKGTQSGETFRLQGKGMPRLRRRGSGDLYVYVQVVTPESLNEEQRESLKAFAEAGGEEIDVSEGFFEKIKNSL